MTGVTEDLVYSTPQSYNPIRGVAASAVSALRSGDFSYVGCSFSEYKDTTNFPETAIY